MFLLYVFLGTGVTVNAIHPGVVDSELSRYSYSLGICKAVFRFTFKTPKEGAQTSIYCAVAKELESVSGQYLRWVWDCDLQLEYRHLDSAHLDKVFCGNAQRCPHQTQKAILKWHIAH